MGLASNVTVRLSNATLMDVFSPQQALRKFGRPRGTRARALTFAFIGHRRRLAAVRGTSAGARRAATPHRCRGR